MKKKIIVTSLALIMLTGVSLGQSVTRVKKNEKLVKDAMTALFVNRDISAIDKYWAKVYIQHNPHIPNGHKALIEIVKGLKPDFKYVPGLAVADGDFVMIHGRYIGWGQNPMIAVDIFRVKNGKLSEHWDVMQEEVPAAKTASGNAMFPAQ